MQPSNRSPQPTAVLETMRQKKYLHFRLEDIFKLDDILSESTDSSGKLFGGHRIFIHHPAESLFVHIDLWNVHTSGGGSVKLLFDLVGAFAELVKKSRGDCQSVASAQVGDFSCVAEGRSHNDGVVSVLLVVVVDFGDRNHARVFGGRERINTLVLLVPVIDTPDEWGNKGCSGFGAGNGLCLGED